ncbi:hypothetical protein JRO89_XSUnG0176600 [Xanthoceras sorbifolium]|uniref:NADH dehydrogenase [ubiquinone] 1 alpha subcomplex subunit 12 n=1 Tax=Xanthoceras sorbifolium TaxID=99658 RepID=A0ABQ8GXY8_9ROSI|nr:hypothetical protein JRO89_XSUnG0176600 [Xanthoceras sorbifolium]
MSKLLSRIAGFFSSRSIAGVDKAGNRYFSRTEEIDGLMKEKRWVVFKGEQDPTSIPDFLLKFIPFAYSVSYTQWLLSILIIVVEWICWLNGQRKRAPTPEEMAELEARREQVRLNVALLKKEEEERRAREGSVPKDKRVGKVGGPDLKSFIQQLQGAAEGDRPAEASYAKTGVRTEETEAEKSEPVPESAEPTGSGSTFRPGTWQPPT